LLADDLCAAGCAIRADARARAIVPDLPAAEDTDFDTEWLDAVISIAIVDGVDDALAHIARHGSSHTEAIVTEDPVAAQHFLAACDSAVTLWNASTQFCDGGEFGFGAEIGIATGRLHARGPVGPDQLTTFRYQVFGSGQIRP
jgi:glutamate-5-semialdehyde dehydrogenase